MDALLEKLMFSLANSTLKTLEARQELIFKLKYWRNELPPEFVINNLMELESLSFSPEIRYTQDEFENLFKEDNSVLLLLSNASNAPLAFTFGFQDPENSSSFYIDACASVVRKKGIMKQFVSIIYIWAYFNGYNSIRLRTEEVGYDGVPLLLIYTNHGFEEIHRDEKGIYLQLSIEKKLVDELISEFLGEINEEELLEQITV